MDLMEAGIDEADAIQAVENSGFVAYRKNGNWVVANSYPAGFTGWGIEKAWKGHARKWWIESGTHRTQEPRQMGDAAKSIYADHALGYTLD